MPNRTFRYRIKYCAHYDCVLGSSEGKMVQNEVADYMEEIALTARNFDCKRVLHDLRSVDFSLNPSDIYFLPEKARDLGFTPMKRAIICNNLNADLSFMETAFHNAGQSLHVFDNVIDMKQWLGIKPSHRCPQPCLAEEPDICCMSQLVEVEPGRVAAG